MDQAPDGMLYSSGSPICCQTDVIRRYCGRIAWRGGIDLSAPQLPLGVALLSGVHHQDYLSAAFAANRHCRIVAVGDEPGVPDDFRNRATRLARLYSVPFVEDVCRTLGATSDRLAR